MKYLALFFVLALPLTANAQDVRTRHDTVKNSIRDVRATVDTTVTNTQTIAGSVGTTIPGVLGDPIPGCVGRVCGGTIQ